MCLTSPVSVFRVKVASSTFSGDSVVLSIVLLSTCRQQLPLQATTSRQQGQVVGLQAIPAV